MADTLREVIRDPIERFRAQRRAFGDQKFLARMSGSEVADLAIRSYQAIAWTFLRRTVLPTIFCLAAWLFVVKFSGDLFSTNQVAKSRQVTELFLKLALCLGAALPVFLIGVSWVTAVITALAADWMLDRVPDGNVASKRALQALPRIASAGIREAILGLGACLASLLLLFFSSLLPESNSNSASIGIFLLGIAGIVVGSLIALYVAIIYSLVPVIILVEGLKPGPAAKRSRQLVSAADAQKKNDGQAALVLVAGATILAAIGTSAAWGTFEELAGVSGHIRSWMPGTIFNVALEYAWDLVPVFLILWIVLPIWCLGSVAVYFNARVRFEGYDIDLLAGEVWQQDKRARFEI